MARLILFCFALLLCSAPAVAAPTGNPHCIYLSPLPGAANVSTASGLIVRFNTPVDPASVAGVQLAVTGSRSGPIAGKLSVSDDHRTVLFRPAREFAPGENVRVYLAGGIAARNGTGLGTLAWSFSTTSRSRARTTGSFLAALRAELSTAPRPATPPAGKTLARAADTLPPGFPAVQVGVNLAPLSGGLFLSNFAVDPAVANTPYLMVLDGAGNPLFSRQIPNIGFDFKRQDNGLYTYFQEGEGRYVALDRTLTPVASYRAGNGFSTDGHDLRLLPDGHALLLAGDTENVDMSRLVPGGDSAAVVAENVIQELDTAGSVVFEWRTRDHFKITDATLVDLTGSLIDAVHANALEVDADGNILLSSRHLDEITKINRQTGDIIWRLGGRNNQFRLLGDTLWFSHQHAVRRLANGHYTLFDNGNGHTPPFSRAVEYELDTAAMTARLVWQFVHPDVYAFALGYVQRLADGNTLIGWGAASPALSVVTPEGRIVNELSLPEGVFSYRAYELSWSGTLAAVSLPGAAAPSGFALAQNYPNPFNPSTIIRFSVPSRSFVTLSVYNMLGQKIGDLVKGEMEPGEHSVRFDAGRLPSGVYFYRLESSGMTRTARMILLK